MSGQFALGVDVGATTVWAAVCRATDGDDIFVETLRLGETAAPMAAAVLVEADGTMSVGDEAMRGAVTAPHRLLGDLPRRVGSGVPFVVAGTRVQPEAALARVIEHVVTAATRTEGTPPGALAVAHPADWGDHRVEALRAALAGAGLGEVTFVPQPLAAARDHVATDTIRPQTLTAIFDLGGSALRSSVVRRGEGDDIDLAAEPRTLVGVGGAAFDDAVLTHTLACLPLPLGADGTVEERANLGALRADCIRAKEDLSAHPEEVIDVSAVSDAPTVRLTRTEFEAMIEPVLDRAVLDFSAALEAVNAPVDDILLVGGSSRVPRVSQKLSETFDRHVNVVDDAGAAAARGAARVALASGWAVPVMATVTTDPSEDDAEEAARRGPWARLFAGRMRWAAAGVAGTALVGLVLVVNSLQGSLALGSINSLNSLTGNQQAASMPGTLPLLPDFPLNPAVPSATPGEDEAAPTDIAPPPHEAGSSRIDYVPPVETADPPGSGESTGTRPTGTTTRPTTVPRTSTAPATSNPAPSTGNPTTSQPATTDPGTTDPGPTDPGTTDPGPTDPGTTDPGTTDPGPTDPGTTDPGTSEPTEPSTDPGPTTDPTTDPPVDPATEEPTTAAEVTLTPAPLSPVAE